MTQPTTPTFDSRILINAQTMGSDRSSDVQFIPGVQASVSVTFQWANLTGTKDGTFKIQGTNAKAPSAIDWETIASYTLQGGDPDTGAKTLRVDLFHDSKMRVVYEKNGVSGGTLTAVGTSKKPFA